MADGEGCVCHAHGECECACGADWMPQELIDARAEIARLRLTDEERKAIERADFVLTHAGLEQSAATLRGMLARCAISNKT